MNKFPCIKEVAISFPFFLEAYDYHEFEERKNFLEAHTKQTVKYKELDFGPDTHYNAIFFLPEQEQTLKREGFLDDPE